MAIYMAILSLLAVCAKLFRVNDTLDAPLTLR
jgi:hypothetical protein